MGGRTDTAGQRLAIYRSLAARNRWIAGLRAGVPVAGVLVFLGLAAQIFIANLGSEFGIGGISIDRTTARIETPRYAGMLADGSTYKVAAGAARADIANPNEIALLDASLQLIQPDGTEMMASAGAATLFAQEQQVAVAAETEVGDSTGTTGRFTDTVIDLKAETFTARGGAELRFSDGTHLTSKTLTYAFPDATWRFGGVRVTMPATPGEAAPPGAADAAGAERGDGE